MIRNPLSPSRPRGSAGGFSLPELVVAVAIIGILAAAAVPAFQNMIIQSRLSSQTNDLISAIQAARGEAIRRNQQIRFCRTASTTSTDCAGAGNWEFWIAVNTNSAVLRRGNVLRDGNNQALLTITSNLALGLVTFFPDGTNSVTAGSDSITVCSPSGSGNTARVITFGLAGRTSITKTTGACS